jgi:hypothetical protein
MNEYMLLDPRGEEVDTYSASSYQEVLNDLNEEYEPRELRGYSLYLKCGGDVSKDLEVFKFEKDREPKVISMSIFINGEKVKVFRSDEPRPEVADCDKCECGGTCGKEC